MFLSEMVKSLVYLINGIFRNLIIRYLYLPCAKNTDNGSAWLGSIRR